MNFIYKKAAALILALSLMMTCTVSVTAQSSKKTASAAVTGKGTSSSSTTKAASTNKNSSTKPTSTKGSGTASSIAKTSKTGSTTSTTTNGKQTSQTTAEADEDKTLEVPSIKAGAAIVMDCNTGTVLYGLNENSQMPMASTTKIMTCILALESGSIGRTITITEECLKQLDGTLIGLKVGDKITMHDLCVAMMMYSGNDAANSAAVAVAGTIDNFVSMMNEKASELGMLNTHFDTPSGLDQFSDGTHYSTAYDMALLASYAMKNPDFADIVNFRVRSIYYDDFPRGRNLVTHNYLLQGQKYGYKGCDGIKTGVTNLAGECLVSHITSEEGLSLVCVSLNDSNRWYNHRKLYDYARSLYTQMPVDAEISEFNSVVVGGSKKTVSVECHPDEKFNVLKTQKNNVKKQVVYDKFIYAPIETGDVVGHLQYVADGTVVASYPITATESVKATTSGWFSEYMQAIKFSSENN